MHLRWSHTRPVLMENTSHAPFSHHRDLNLRITVCRILCCRFTPDFSMSRVTRKLEVKTTLGPVMEFTLVATIPTHLLPLCSSALGRNSWEPVVQVVAVVLMGVVFLAVVIAAYAEARRLVFLSHPEMQLLQMKEEERGPIFDLNAIAGVKKHK